MRRQRADLIYLSSRPCCAPSTLCKSFQWAPDMPVRISIWPLLGHMQSCMLFQRDSQSCMAHVYERCPSHLPLRPWYLHQAAQCSLLVGHVGGTPAWAESRQGSRRQGVQTGKQMSKDAEYGRSHAKGEAATMASGQETSALRD